MSLAAGQGPLGLTWEAWGELLAEWLAVREWDEKRARWRPACPRYVTQDHEGNGGRGWCMRCGCGARGHKRRRGAGT